MLGNKQIKSTPTIVKARKPSVYPVRFLLNQLQSAPPRRATMLQDAIPHVLFNVRNHPWYVVEGKGVPVFPHSPENCYGQRS
jgi:hypothetical protein